MQKLKLPKPRAEDPYCLVCNPIWARECLLKSLDCGLPCVPWKRLPAVDPALPFKGQPRVGTAMLSIQRWWRDCRRRRGLHSCEQHFVCPCRWPGAYNVPRASSSHHQEFGADGWATEVVWRPLRLLDDYK